MKNKKLSIHNIKNNYERPFINVINETKAIDNGNDIITIKKGNKTLFVIYNNLRSVSTSPDFWGLFNVYQDFVDHDDLRDLIIKKYNIPNYSVW